MFLLCLEVYGLVTRSAMRPQKLRSSISAAVVDVSISAVTHGWRAGTVLRDVSAGRRQPAGAKSPSPSTRCSDG